MASSAKQIARRVTADLRLGFQRGTVRCVVEPPQRLAELEALHPFASWEPEIPGYRVAAADHAALVRALVSLEIRFVDEVNVGSWSGVDGTTASPVHLAAPALRPYQEVALAAWQGNDDRQAASAARPRRGVLVLPTGSGKTHVALGAMARCGVPALILVPTRALLRQWEQLLRLYSKASIGIVGDGQHRLAPITLATLDAAQRHMATSLGNRFGLLVVDEAHHLGSPIRQELAWMSTAPHRLGLTATPPYGEAASRMQQVLGPIAFELGASELRGRFLAELDIVRLRLELTPHEREAYDRARQEYVSIYSRFCSVSGRMSFRDFASTAGHTRDGRRAVKAWYRARRVLGWTVAKETALAALLQRYLYDDDAPGSGGERAPGHRILIFTADRDSAFRIARRFLIMPITGDIGRREREKALERFRAGELRALVSPRVLNEGIDVPAADVGIVVGAGLGSREQVQRVGRLLRPSAGRGTAGDGAAGGTAGVQPHKRAVIYELVCRHTTEERRRGPQATS